MKRTLDEILKTQVVRFPITGSGNDPWGWKKIPYLNEQDLQEAARLSVWWFTIREHTLYGLSLGLRFNDAFVAGYFQSFQDGCWCNPYKKVDAPAKP